MSEKLYQGCEPRIIERVPIHLKMVLTIREAAEYSNIGINKIESMLKMCIRDSTQALRCCTLNVLV